LVYLTSYRDFSENITITILRMMSRTRS